MTGELRKTTNTGSFFTFALGLLQVKLARSLGARGIGDKPTDSHSRAIWRLNATGISHYESNHYTGRPLRGLQWRAKS
jgi:hypothetical protein